MEKHQSTQYLNALSAGTAVLKRPQLLPEDPPNNGGEEPNEPEPEDPEESDGAGEEEESDE
ncbi:hypothetical protein OSO01_16830 [Oceanobacillus sojae]|uniref:Uncharacterized protein n=1 Tax=Oceanobacillus sojae TaxID=582851 RepID=A0A511ZHN2_9BACI|nr:hypothetical protein OSO01_16830 [Oceanobacillus sojae]